MITAIRFRAEGETVVLQVQVTEPKAYTPYESIALWRDAKVEDLLDVSAFCRNNYDSRMNDINMRLDSMESDLYVHTQKEQA